MSSQISRSPTPPPPLPSHIQDLIDKGVKYIEYQDVHLDVELGSVSGHSLSVTHACTSVSVMYVHVSYRATSVLSTRELGETNR